jgi:hypothetical protein
MTREDFRRELGDAFDSISGSPDPALSDRVRAALVEAPEHRGPVWIAALAAAVIAVILVGVLFVGNPLNRHIGSVGPGIKTPSASPSPTPTPDRICGSSAKVSPGKQYTPPTAFMDALRTGANPGYDRVTFEFKNGLPTSFELRPQNSSTFTLSPKGQSVTLAGTNGILVIIKGADAHTSYTGTRDIKTGYTGLAEVRLVEDNEGTVSFGLGLNVSPCYAPFTLKSAILLNPYRVTIDIPTT